MSKIFISHGEKGGLGKSRLAMVLIDLLHRRGRDIALVEGDKSGADVGLRFNGLLDVGFINLNRPDAMEDAFSNLGGWLQDHGDGKDVVINLPGQATATLDKFADLLAGTVEMLGHELVVYYSVGNLDIHTSNLLTSMREGLMSVVPIEKQVVVVPLMFGDPAGYHWYRASERTRYLEAGGKEGVMPLLKPAVLEEFVRATPGYYSTLLESASPLKIADRGLLFRWLTAAHKVAALGVDHE
jgi:hypothetical protein